MSVMQEIEILASDDDPRAPRIVTWPVRLMQVVGCAAIVIMGAHIVIDVVARNLFNSPFIQTMDFIQYWWMPIACMSGIAYAQYVRDHVIVETIFSVLSPLMARILKIAVLVVATVFVAILAFYAWEHALERMAVGDYGVSSKLPIWPPTFIAPVAMAVFALCMIWQAIALVRSDVESSTEEVGS